MRYAWPILGIFAARFFATAAFYPGADGDLAWQRWLGRTIQTTGRLPRMIGLETFTAPAAAWVPQEWLFSLAASLSTGAGWYLFATCTTLCAVATLYIGARRAARTGATPLAVGLALAFAGVALFESFGVRAQVFAWPLLALFLFFIELDSPLAYYALAVAAIWSNIHASVMLAGPLALVAAVGTYLDEGWSSRTQRTLWIGFGSLLATCCNPLGFNLPRYAVMLFSSPFKNMIAEWKHTDFGDSSFAFGSLPLLFIIAALGIRCSTRWRDRCIALTTAMLMFWATRNIPIFAIASFPIVARSLSAGVSFFAVPERPAKTRAEVYAARLVPAFSMILSVFVALALCRSRQDASASDKLAPTIAAVRALPGTPNVLCADFAWCSFLIGNSRARVFLDGRADPYPQTVWTDYETVIRVKHGWQRALRSRGADVVIVNVKSPLEEVLELSSDWRSTYRNDTYRVWTRVSALVSTHSVTVARTTR